mgnify:CR=1 FL=1
MQQDLQEVPVQPAQQVNTVQQEVLDQSAKMDQQVLQEVLAPREGQVSVVHPDQQVVQGNTAQQEVPVPQA